MIPSSRRRGRRHAGCRRRGPCRGVARRRAPARDQTPGPGAPSWRPASPPSGDARGGARTEPESSGEERDELFARIALTNLYFCNCRKTLKCYCSLQYSFIIVRLSSNYTSDHSVDFSMFSEGMAPLETNFIWIRVDLSNLFLTVFSLPSP